MNKTLLRFLKYSSVGVSTFLFDLILLTLLIERLWWEYLLATGLSFLIAISINYILSRRFVFTKTQRWFQRGYIGFLLIALVGMILVLTGMKICVGILGWHYTISRILIACVVGIGNYLTNLYFNFRVAGKH